MNEQIRRLRRARDRLLAEEFKSEAKAVEMATDLLVRVGHARVAGNLDDWADEVEGFLGLPREGVA